MGLVEEKSEPAEGKLSKGEEPLKPVFFKEENEHIFDFDDVSEDVSELSEIEEEGSLPEDDEAKHETVFADVFGDDEEVLPVVEGKLHPDDKEDHKALFAKDVSAAKIIPTDD